MSVRDDLDSQGFAVVRGLVPKQMCARIVDAISLRTGLDPNDPDTWDRGAGAVPTWGHQALWDVRQYPPVYEAWAEAWGTDQLWASYDGCGFTPPWRPGLPDALPIHWDQDPLDEDTRFLQGTVALSDVAPQGGGFRCAPAWMNAPELWPEAWPQRPWGEVWEVEPPADDIVEVEVEVGDVVIWSSRLPHGTTRNTGTQPRMVFFLSYRPAGGEDEAAQRVSDFETGLAPDHQRWKPGHGDPEPWPPADLTDLGERLLGRRPWTSTP